KTEKRGPLQTGIVAASALVQHAGECLEPAGEIALRDIRTPQAVERSCLASSVSKRVIEIAAPAIVGNRTGEITLHELDVAGADQRGGNAQTVVEPFLDCQ